MFSILTTVVDEASSFDLTSLTNVKAEMGITVTTYDTLLSRYISSASLAAAKFCNRVFVVEGVQDRLSSIRDSVLFRNRADVLQLSRWPVVDIISVVVDGTTLVEDTDFLTDAVNGQLTRIDSSGLRTPWCGSVIVINYEAGYETIPSDVEDAAIRMVTARYRSKGRDRNVKSDTVDGVGAIQYWIPSGSDAGNLTPDVCDILESTAFQ
jgi:hypothetical protein